MTGGDTAVSPGEAPIGDTTSGERGNTPEETPPPAPVPKLTPPPDAVTSLDLRNTDVTTFNFAEYPYLENFALQGSNISDLTLLSGLTNLGSLQLDELEASLPIIGVFIGE